MVKADVRRDYYADLGLAPSAEHEDIKKQFRKLALKYHPDRNPGKEHEFNAKFQAIQAANEILSDPQQRLKYDTDRLRAGYGKFYGPPKANTQRKAQPSSYSTSKSQNPKPPNSARPHSSSNGPSAGAQRYATHARAGPQQWQNAQDDAQTRADAFRGFQGMRGTNMAGASTPGWQSFDPRTGRTTPTSGAAPRPNASFGKSARPKSAYEYFKAQATGSSPQSAAKKRQGFAPGTAGGDEPMARNTSAYTNVPRTERPTSQYFESATPPTTKKPAAPEPFARPFPATGFAQDFERTSNRYAASGGEKTFFSSTGFGHSTSVRTPSGSYRSNSHTNPTSPPVSGQQPYRHRSASPKERPGRDRSYSMSTSSSDPDEDDDEEGPVHTVPRPSAFKPKAVPKSRLRAHQKSTDFRTAEAPSPGTGERPFTQAGVPDPRPSTPPSQAYFRSWRPRRTPNYMDWTTDSDDAKGHNSDSAAFPKGPSRSDPHFKFQDQTSRNFEASDRPNHLHKKFSVDDWRDHLSQFDFTGAGSADKDGLRGSPNSKKQGRSSTRTQPAQPAESFNSTVFAATPQTPPSQLPSQQAPTPFAQAKFSVDQWAEQLRNLAWNVPPTDKSQQPANMPPPPRNPKKPSSRPGVKVRSTPQPARVASEAEEANVTVNGNNAAESIPTSAAEAEAMDLDDDLPPPPSTSSMPANGAAEPSGSASYPDLSSHAAPDAREPAQKTQSPSQTKNTAPPSAAGRTPLFSLDNFRNTAPFTNTNNGGIENLQDVHATLPFESRAKQPTTTKRDIRPRELNIPNPPKRPRAPAPVAHPGSQQLVLPRDQWNRYVSEMNTYMREWNQFNRRMLTHFNARQEAVETGLAPGWISAVGDTARLMMNGTDDDGDGDGDRSDLRDKPDELERDEYLVPGSGKGGFSAYLRGIEEDAQVRKHWEVACEMHRDCILNLGRLREWIRNGGKVL